MDKKDILCIPYYEPTEFSLSLTNSTNPRVTKRRYKVRENVKVGVLDFIKMSNYGLISEYGKYRNSVNFNQLIYDLRTELAFNQSLHQNIGSYLSSDSKNYRSVLPHLKIISEGTVSGVVAFGTPTFEGYPFSVKVEKDPNGGDILNEAYIGFSALNGLKKYIPNFYYVYDMFSCDNVDTYYERVLSFCDYEGDFNILAGERVPDAIPLRKYLQNMTPETFNIVFLQLMNALNLAYRTSGFVHGDLHLDNVLVRIFDSPVKVPIYNPDLSYCGYINTTIVPYIIDYGYSHINTETGNTAIPRDSYWPGLSIYPSYDTHRLFMAAAIELNKVSDLTSDEKFYEVLLQLSKEIEMDNDKSTQEIRELEPYYKLSYEREKLTRNYNEVYAKILTLNDLIQQYGLEGLDDRTEMENFPDYQNGKSKQHEKLLTAIRELSLLEHEEQELLEKLDQNKKMLKKPLHPTEEIEKDMNRSAKDALQMLKIYSPAKFYDNTILEQFKFLFHSIFPDYGENVMYDILKAANRANYNKNRQTEKEEIEYNQYYGIISKDMVFKAGEKLPRDHQEGLQYMIDRSKNIILPFKLPDQEIFDSCSFLNKYWSGNARSFENYTENSAERSDSFFKELDAVIHYLKKWNDYILSNPINKETEKSSTIFILLTKALSIASDFTDKVKHYGTEDEESEIASVYNYWKTISEYTDSYYNLRSYRNRKTEGIVKEKFDKAKLYLADPFDRKI